MTLVLEESLTLEELSIPGYERVIKVTDERVGLKAIICLHDLTLGPALGGTRIYPYPTFEAALNDVMRLAKGMTYKSALAETGFGGGKAVIIADPKRDKSEQLLRAYGQAVHRLKGQFITAEDLGCTVADAAVINGTTPYIVGLPHEKSSGDPGPFTAWGTFRGVQAVLKKIYGDDSLQDRVVAVQGLGNVGEVLAEHLFWGGAKLILTDLNEAKLHRLAKLYGAETCRPDEIFTVDCDVFAPCALGGILNPKVIPALRCRAIAGSANNQLLKDSDADALKKRGILYAPDFVINAGGLINVTQELEENGYEPRAPRTKAHHIYQQLLTIFEIAEHNNISTHAAAVSLADYRLKYRIGKRHKTTYFHHSQISM